MEAKGGKEEKGGIGCLIVGEIPGPSYHLIAGVTEFFDSRFSISALAAIGDSLNAING